MRKLLALASRPGTPAEAAAALAAATTLAARHGLQIVRHGDCYELVAPVAQPPVPESRHDTPRRPSRVDDYVECLWCTRRIRVRAERPTPLYCDMACRANAHWADRRR